MDNETQNREEKRALIEHVAPFAVWMLLMIGLGDPAGWKYAVRSAAGLAVLLAMRPWRYYPALRLRNIPLAVVAGVVVLVLWVAPESPLAAGVPSLQQLYLKWAVLPLGRLPEFPAASPYDPALCGWTLTVVRLAGSAFVIAAIEEFFWRGFLYRWVASQRFLTVDIGRFHGVAFAVSCALFGVEHDRWLAGALAGVVYALVMIRTRDIWAAAVAHITTNLLLGIYVVATGAYAFW